MTSDDPREETKIERDHPQTRKGEDDARGSAMWNEDVRTQPVRESREHDRNRREASRGGEPDRNEGRDNPTVAELAEEAAAVRSQAVGAKTSGDAPG